MPRSLAQPIGLAVFFTGCGVPYLAPSTSRLDLVQAARLDENQTQVGVGVGALSAGLGARQTFGMGNDAAGDVGLWFSTANASLDGGLWLPTRNSFLRLGVIGGFGQSGLTSLERAETGRYEFPYGGGSIHVQHALGKKKQMSKTAWTFTHGYGYAGYFALFEDDRVPSLNLDAAFRADFKARKDRGMYTAFGLGLNWFIPNATVRAGYRF